MESNSNSNYSSNSNNLNLTSVEHPLTKLRQRSDAGQQRLSNSLSRTHTHVDSPVRRPDLDSQTWTRKDSLSSKKLEELRNSQQQFQQRIIITSTPSISTSPPHDTPLASNNASPQQSINMNFLSPEGFNSQEILPELHYSPLRPKPRRKSTILDKSFQDQLENTNFSISSSVFTLMSIEIIFFVIVIVVKMFSNGATTAGILTLLISTLFFGGMGVLSMRKHKDTFLISLIQLYGFIAAFLIILIICPNSYSSLVLVLGLFITYSNILQTTFNVSLHMGILLILVSLTYLLKVGTMTTDCYTTGYCTSFVSLNMGYSVFWVLICALGLVGAIALENKVRITCYEFNSAEADLLVGDNLDLQNQLRVARIKPEMDIAAPLTRATQLLVSLNDKNSGIVHINKDVQKILDILNSDKLFEPDFFQDTGDNEVTNYLQDVLQKRKQVTVTRLRAMTTPAKLIPQKLAKSVQSGASKIQSILFNINDPFFDVFSLEVASEGHALYYVASTIFKELDFGAQLSINENLFKQWILKMEMGYDRNNPYHNPSHAADVTQVMYYFITRAKLKDQLTIEDLFACVIAAIGHDYMHPGFTNAFLIATKNPLALRYNDTSVLEHFHASSVGELFAQSEFDLLTALSMEQKKYIRDITITMILATDMSFHFEWLSKFKNKLSTNSINLDNSNDRKLVLNMAMKCSDINNLTKPLETSRMWTQCIIEEFFKQGDQEKARNLPVSMFMDRNNTDIPKCQIGFVDYIVLPLYESWASYLTGEIVEHINNLKINKAFWKSQSESGVKTESVFPPSFKISVLRVKHNRVMDEDRDKSDSPDLSGAPRQRLSIISKNTLPKSGGAASAGTEKRLSISTFDAGDALRRLSVGTRTSSIHRPTPDNLKSSNSVNNFKPSSSMRFTEEGSSSIGDGNPSPSEQTRNIFSMFKMGFSATNNSVGKESPPSSSTSNSSSLNLGLKKEAVLPMFPGVSNSSVGPSTGPALPGQSFHGLPPIRGGTSASSRMPPPRMTSFKHEPENTHEEEGPPPPLSGNKGARDHTPIIPTNVSGRRISFMMDDE